MTDTTEADGLASEMIAATPETLPSLWRRAQALPAPALGWALKRACYAAWSTQPPVTAVAAGLAEDLAQRSDEDEVCALAAWTRGIAQLALGQLEAAQASLVRAGELFTACTQPLAAAQTGVARVMALAMLGRYDEAERCGAQARAVFDAHGDARAAGKIELNLGNLAARREQHDLASAHYRQAQLRLAEAGDTEFELMATKGLAAMQAQQHELDSADALYSRALAQAEQAGLAVLEALIQRDLGALQLRRGHYDHALQSLEQARASLARLALPHELALAQEWLGDAYLELNLLPEALALYESSLASYEAAGAVTDRAWGLSQRGRALTLLGRHQAAAAALAQAERAFTDEGNPVGVALVQGWLAELALRRGDLAATVELASTAEPALASARHLSGVLQVRLLRAEALRAQGRADEAQPLALAAQASADALGLVAAQRRARVLLGLLARDRGDAATAAQHFESAVAVIESQRGLLPSEEFRAAFLGHSLLPYQELVRASLASQQGNAAEEALQWIERARARALADALDSPVRDDDSADPALREVARLQSQLQACYRALASPDTRRATHWMDQARETEAALLEAGRRQALTVTATRSTASPVVLDLDALHAALGDHSALVEYFSIDDALHVCVAAGGRVHSLQLPCTLGAVQASVEQLRFQTDTLRRGAARLAHRLPELQQRALHHLQNLHAALWAPLQPWLGERRAVVVPHGTLHYLPFEALHDGQQHEIERRELCRAPSAALLLRGLAQQPRRWQTALVLGHADERLPQVAAEVAAVAACFPDGDALHGGAATGQALRGAGPADVLHIACHAQFRNDSPRFSALHLADGAFTVRDAARLRLNRGLVTLSACETAVSAVLPGDELIGLTHAFMSAGASRVLASLWAVQDESTAAFMPAFYQRLREGSPPGQALRLTQLQALARQPHPYFWAAFTLHGGW